MIDRRSPVSIAAAAIYMASQASDDKKTAKGKQRRIYLQYLNLAYNGFEKVSVSSICL